MRWLPILVVLMAGACESKPSDRSQSSNVGPGSGSAKGPKTTDDCELFFKKARPLLTKMAKASGMAMKQSIEDAGIRDCREDLARGVRSKLIDCVLQARDEASVEACFPRYDELTLPAGAGSGSATGSANGAAH
jgi:hypothetical protein